MTDNDATQVNTSGADADAEMGAGMGAGAEMEAGAGAGAGVMVWVMRALALAALAVSGLLLYQVMEAWAVPPGCGSGSGCEKVFASGWGWWFGVPVAALAVGVYVVLLGALANVGQRRTAGQRQAAWAVLVVGAVGIVAAAIWFVGLQLFVIGAVCKYCMAAHGLGVVLAVLIFAQAPIGKAAAGRLSKRLVLGLVGVGLVGAVVLVVGETLSRPAQHRVVEYGHITINVQQYPVIGSRNAEHVLVLFADYTCPFCREMHGYVQAALKRYGLKQLAVAIAPLSLDAKCNPYVVRTQAMHEGACKLAKIALAVWRIKPGAFAAMDAWLFAANEKRTAAAALKKAGELVGGQAKVKAMMREKWEEKFLRAQADLNYQLGQEAKVNGQPVGDGVPKLVLNRSFMEVGVPDSKQAFFKDLEQQLGIKPIGKAKEIGGKQ